MRRIAIKMLLGDRARYLTLLSGLIAVSFLFIQQGSIFCGLILRTATPIDAVDAPIWVADPTLESIDSNVPLLDTDLQRVRSVRGVAWAVPLILQQVQVHLKSGRTQQVRLYGLDNDTLTGRPQKMIWGNSADLLKDQAVIIGQAESDRLDNPVQATTFEINDYTARVVGMADVPRDFLSNPYLFTTYDRALDYIPPARKQLSLILAAPAPGVSIAEACRQIRTATGLAAYSKGQFRWHTMGYYLKNTGIPINIGISLALVFLVGTSITGQTFYQFALQNERYFGAFKAMGAEPRLLVGMMFLQAMLVGSVGFGIGAGMAGIFGLIVGTPSSKIAYATTWQLGLASAVIIMLVCAVSSVFSIRRVVRLEPAVVFHG